MNLRVAHAAPGIALATAANGDVYVRGERLTDAGGWIDVQVAGAKPRVVSVRLLVELDAEGRFAIFVEQVRAGRMNYAGVHSLVAIEGRAWLQLLTTAVQHAIEQRLAEMGARGALAASVDEAAQARRAPSGQRMRTSSGLVEVSVDASRDDDADDDAGLDDGDDDDAAMPTGTRGPRRAR